MIIPTVVKNFETLTDKEMGLETQPKSVCRQKIKNGQMASKQNEKVTI